ncbi:positive regulation of interleukin-4-mediated signaling pathway [Branchiostoma belcheri]|nr:positive regulation of interleukin-4-mediated signaling pathway [Branchiostoma belcheri]
MEKAHASTTWPVGSDQTNMKIAPTLTKATPNLTIFAENWASNARDGLKSYLARFDSKEIADVMQISWPHVCRLVDDDTLKYDDTISIHSTSDRKITFTGLNDSVAKHYQLVMEGKRKIEGDIKRKQSEVDETISTLKPEQVRLLALSNFKERMTNKFPKLQISFDTGRSMVKFYGFFDEIQQTKMAMYKTVQGVISQRVKLSPTLVSFLANEKESKQHLLSEYKRASVVAVITTTTSEVEVYGLSYGDMKKAVSILNNTFQEQRLDVPHQSTPVLGTEEWKTTKTDLEQSAQGLLKISVESNADSGATKILFTGESAFVKDIRDRVETYLRVNTIYEQQVEADYGKIRFIKEHQAANLQVQLEKHQVSLRFNGSEESPTMSIKGNSDGIRKANQILKSFIDNMIADEMSIKKPGMSKHFREDAGRSTLQLIEKTCKCTINIQDAMNKTPAPDTFAKQSMPTSPTLVPQQKAVVNLDDRNTPDVWRDELQPTSLPTPFRFSRQLRDLVTDVGFRTTEGKAITVIQANIANQNTDVLVNTTADSLNLNNGAVSKAILQLAGSNLQTLVNAAKQRAGITSLPDGQILVTDSALLPCKQVIHCSLCSWDGGQGNSEKALRNIIKQCLQQAEKGNYKSIALPAMGTGVLRFPHDVVAEAIFNEAVEHFKTNPSGSLREIRFVVWEGDPKSIPAFHAVMTKYKAMQTSDARQPASRYTYATAATGPFGGEPRGRGRLGRADSKGVIGEQGAGSTVTTWKDKDTNLQIFDGYQSILFRERETRPVTCIGLPGPTPCCLPPEEAAGVGPDRPIQVSGLVSRSREIRPLREQDGLIAIENLEEFKQNRLRGGQTRPTMRRSNKTDYQPILSPYTHPLSLIPIAPGAVRAACGSAKDFHLSRSSASWFAVPPDNPAKIAIYSDNPGSISRAKEMINKTIDEISKDETIPSKFRLTEEQKQHVSSLAHSHDCLATFTRSNIRLQGRGIDVILASHDIKEFQRDVEMKAKDEKHLREKAELLLKNVQWYYVDDKEEKQPYDAKVNYMIEEAHAASKAGVDFEFEGEDLHIDFQTMRETVVGDVAAGATEVVRHEPEKEGNIKLPKTWTGMSDDDQYKEVDLQPTTDEYKKVHRQFMQSVVTASGRYRAVPTARVLKIQRIQNVPLWHQYMVRKKTMDQDNANRTQPVERILYHGTPADPIPSINRTGFNRSYSGRNVGAAYGNGVYFAVSASLSAADQYARPDPNGHRYMYMARVLSGEMCQGERNIIVPPAKDPIKSHITYDSVCDNTRNPKIIVIFYDAQSYPEYLITFTK